MALFKGRSSLLEVQNRALIKTAKDRAAQIEKLEAELEILRPRAVPANELRHELQSCREKAEQLQRRAERQSEEIERLTLERDFYSKRVLALEQENRELTESATKYSLQAQKVERELTEVATQYSLQAQKLERELTETVRRAEDLERELARIDPDGAPARRFEGQHQS